MATSMLSQQRASLGVAQSRRTRVGPPRRLKVAPPRQSFTNEVICASTALVLAVGRLGFLPLQRRTNYDANEVAGPKTTGNTYFDSLQEEASFLKGSSNNDPDGFGIIDVLGWGALGHALGFTVLAVSSLVR